MSTEIDDMEESISAEVYKIVMRAKTVDGSGAMDFLSDMLSALLDINDEYDLMDKGVEECDNVIKLCNKFVYELSLEITNFAPENSETYEKVEQLKKHVTEFVDYAYRIHEDGLRELYNR